MESFWCKLTAIFVVINGALTGLLWLLLLDLAYSGWATGPGAIFPFLYGFFGIMFTINSLIYIFVKRVGKKWKAILLIVIAWVIMIGSIMIIEQLPGSAKTKYNALKTEANKNQVTIINEGTGSRGSFSDYMISDAEILELEEEPQIRYVGNIRYGYCYKTLKEGTTNILVLNGSGGRNIESLMVYQVQVDDELNATMQEVYLGRMSYPENITNKMVVEQNWDRLISEYGFTEDQLKEFFDSFL